MPRIKYDKEGSGKKIGRGGPRDVQLRQRIMQEELVRRQLGSDAVVPIMKGGTASAEPIPVRTTDNLSGHLPLEEVRKKIEEAVKYTKASEKERFESGLKNLNDQLNAVRKKYAGYDKTLRQLNEKDLELSKIKTDLAIKSDFYAKSDDEIKALKSQLTELSRVNSELSKSLSEKDIALAEAKAYLISKEENYKQNSESFSILQSKMDELYNKISDGSIQPLIGSKMSRPALEDKIFIDPLEKTNEPELDSHIEVKEEEPKPEASNIDMKSDLAKLKNLLNLN